MINPDEPDVTWDVNPNSSPEQDISETSTVSGTQDIIRVVRAVFITLSRDLGTHALLLLLVLV